jgi:anti-anti-sigma factor
MSLPRSPSAPVDYPRRPPGPTGFALVENSLDEGTTLIQVVGELDSTVVERLFEAVARVPAGPRTVVVALDECEFVDSTAIAAFLQIRSELGADRRLFLCAPSRPVRRTLEVVGLVEAGLVVDDLESVLGPD